MVELLGDHLHGGSLSHSVYLLEIIVGLGEVGEQAVATRDYSSLEVDCLIVEDGRVNAQTPVNGAGLAALQLEGCSVCGESRCAECGGCWEGLEGCGVDEGESN